MRASRCLRTRGHGAASDGRQALRNSRPGGRPPATPGSFFLSLEPGATMRALKELSAKLVRDENGGETIEYALILGLIIVVAIAIIGTVGTKVVGRWTSVNNTL